MNIDLPDLIGWTVIDIFDDVLYLSDGKMIVELYITGDCRVATSEIN